MKKAGTSEKVLLSLTSKLTRLVPLLLGIYLIIESLSFRFGVDEIGVFVSLGILYLGGQSISIGLMDVVFYQNGVLVINSIQTQEIAENIKDVVSIEKCININVFFFVPHYKVAFREGKVVKFYMMPFSYYSSLEKDKSDSLVRNLFERAEKSV